LLRESLLPLLLSVSPLLAQSKPSRPPDQMVLHTDTWTFLWYMHGAYVGLDEGGTHQAWTFHVVAWEPGFIALTGVSLTTDFDGRRKVAVISGVPEGDPANVLHAKLHIIIGDKMTDATATLTWKEGELNGEAAGDAHKKP